MATGSEQKLVPTAQHIILESDNTLLNLLTGECVPLHGGTQQWSLQQSPEGRDHRCQVKIEKRMLRFSFDVVSDSDAHSEML